MSEHFGAFLACFVLHVALLLRFVRAHLPPRSFTLVTTAMLTSAGCVAALVLALVAGYVMRSPTLGWTGRSCAHPPWAKQVRAPTLGWAPTHAVTHPGLDRSVHPPMRSPTLGWTGRSCAHPPWAGRLDRSVRSTASQASEP